MYSWGLDLDKWLVTLQRVTSCVTALPARFLRVTLRYTPLIKGCDV